MRFFVLIGAILLTIVNVAAAARYSSSCANNQCGVMSYRYASTPTVFLPTPSAPAEFVGPIVEPKVDGGCSRRNNRSHRRP
jgi:hypothetical protein